MAEVAPSMGAPPALLSADEAGRFVVEALESRVADPYEAAVQRAYAAGVAVGLESAALSVDQECQGFHPRNAARWWRLSDALRVEAKRRRRDKYGHTVADHDAVGACQRPGLSRG